MALGHMVLTCKSRIIDSFEELSLLSLVEQEDISLSEYSNSCSCVSSGVTAYPDMHIMIPGLIFPFANFHYHPKHLS